MAGDREGSYNSCEGLISYFYIVRPPHPKTGEKIYRYVSPTS